MATSLRSSVIVFASIPGAIIILLWRRYRKAISSSPPAPEQSWYLSLTREAPYKVYREWSRKLGPIMQLRSTNTGKVFMLGTLDVTLDLFDKQSKAFSCRPRFPMIELLGRDENTGFSYYGERLKRSRVLLSRSLAPQAIHQWEQLIITDTNDLMKKLRNDPSQLSDCVQSNVQSFFMRLTYGADPGPQYYELIKTSQAYTGLALRPGQWLVNKYPILKLIPAWFPGASFQRWAIEGKTLFENITRTPFEQVKNQMALKIAGPSFVRNCLEFINAGKVNGDERLAMTTAGSILNAASETTTSAMCTLVYALAADQKIQQRAYDEIISIIGTERFPSLDDRPKLPFINAVLMEVLRFNPPIPILTHSPVEDSEYDGYSIPKTTTVYANVWSILHDDSNYDRPEEFIPERFLGDNPALDPHKVAFGVGRRMCPGRHVAEALLFTFATKFIVLFSADTSDARQFSTHFNGLVSMPMDLGAKLTPRPTSFQAWSLLADSQS